MNLTELTTLDLRSLEELYSVDRPLDIPGGSFRGTVICWFPTPTDQPRWMRPLLWLMFGLSPFGVDFDRRRWFFVFDRSPRVGRFSPVVGPSRWRDTQTIRLHYEVSRLPVALRSQLYDEVKPLSDDLCLGIGGVNEERGSGEQFFFALERIR